MHNYTCGQLIGKQTVLLFITTSTFIIPKLDHFFATYTVYSESSSRLLVCFVYTTVLQTTTFSSGPFHSLLKLLKDSLHFVMPSCSAICIQNICPNLFKFSLEMYDQVHLNRVNYLCFHISHAPQIKALKRRRRELEMFFFSNSKCFFFSASS